MAFGPQCRHAPAADFPSCPRGDRCAVAAGKPQFWRWQQRCPCGDRARKRPRLVTRGSTCGCKTRLKTSVSPRGQSGETGRARGQNSGLSPRGQASGPWRRWAHSAPRDRHSSPVGWTICRPRNARIPACPRGDMRVKRGGTKAKSLAVPAGTSSGYRLRLAEPWPLAALGRRFRRENLTAKQRPQTNLSPRGQPLETGRGVQNICLSPRGQNAKTPARVERFEAKDPARGRVLACFPVLSPRGQREIIRGSGGGQFRTLNSIRRFLARFCAVLFGTSGVVSP